jgi:hypothetical protein
MSDHSDAATAAAPPVFVDEYRMAEALGVPVTRLRAWRLNRIGPPVYKLGPGPRGTVRYDLEESLAWARAQRRTG